MILVWWMKKHMAKVPMMLESFNALDSSGVKAWKPRKSWNYMKFFKMKDKPIFIVKMMMTRLTFTCFSIFLVKWSSSMKSKSVAKSSKELRLSTLKEQKMSTIKQDMRSSRRMYSVMKRCWTERNGRRKFSKRQTGSSMLRTLETNLATQTIKVKRKRHRRKKLKNRKR